MPRLHVLPLAGALFFANACAPGAPASMPAEPAAAVAVSASQPPPAHVDSGAMPGDVQVYAEIADVPSIVDAARSGLGADAFTILSSGAARELGVEPRLVERVLSGIESIHVGAERIDGDLKLASSVVFVDAGPVRELLESRFFVDVEPFGASGRRLEAQGEGRGARGAQVVVWFEGARLLATGDEAMVKSVAAVVEGRAPALTAAQRAAAAPTASDRRQVTGFVAPALLQLVAGNRVSFPSPLTVAYGLWEGGVRGSLRAAIGEKDGSGRVVLPPARALGLARRLPAETAGYVELSTELPGGPLGAALLLAQITAIAGRGVLGDIDGALEGVGLRAVDLLGVLGGEGVLAVVVRAGSKTTAEVERGYAVVLVQEVADTKLAARLLELSRARLATQKKTIKLRAEGSGWSADLLEAPLPFVRAGLLGGRLFVAAGPRDLVARAAAAVEKGQGTLGDDAAHARALSGLPASAQVRAWFDLGRAAELAAASAPVPVAALDVWSNASRGPRRVTSGLSLTAAHEPNSLRLELDEVNGVGVFAALGIYGVRRYLASAKTAEAKSTLSAMSRAAVAAYERETLVPGGAAATHSLCGSAQAVPPAVPQAAKYLPSSQPGMDWDSGDQGSGWRCLKFALSSPQYYQYAYVRGGPYKGPPRGGPDPGPNGFEVSAEGDLDGNGVTSLFTRTGVLDPRTGTVTMAASLFVDKELE